MGEQITGDASLLIAQRTEIERKIRQLKTQVQQCRKRIKNYESDIDEYSDAYDRLVGRKNAINDRIEETLSELNKRASHFSSNTKFSKNYIAEVSSILKGQKSQASLDSINNAITLLKNKIKDCDKSISDENTRIRNLEGQIRRLEIQLNQLR